MVSRAYAPTPNLRAHSICRNNLFHISGTDIVRCLAFRFQAFGRPVKNSKKFEEGIFSDLRNLKAGNDASLEEPKSPFLDFLYKNNCIRTQKKQKVFYWYSVPHDRLFLDALERDLKREKAGQEATTVATFEPALSFEFDQSQSLFEQLTKTNSAAQHMPAFNNPQEAYSQSASPALAAADSMPPPSTSMVSHAMQSMPQDGFNDMASYSQTQMPVGSSVTTRDYYDQNGVPAAVSAAQRQSSMPAPYLEYSPAPSFVSSQSQYEDFSNRGVSYEPITPPQQMNTYTPEPVYASNEDGGLYSALSDAQAGYPTAATNFATPYNNIPKSFPGQTVTPMYSHLEGSPNYKQRRRRSPSASSYSTGVGQMAAPSSMPRPAHSVKRPSDLRRSISMSMDPQQFERAASGPPTSFNYMHQYGSDTPHNISRQGSPMSTIEDQQGMSMMQQQRYNNMMNDGLSDGQSGMPGAFRRARSATVDIGPYPQKSHSCPIPSCGRLFKRLEHLKR